ncbi:cadmium-translocating P-type ATPase [Pseudaminobacter sp. 19-2017]|uniref:Cadmium-translocating P-type ATPase n=1 Tax=Pseudaminobacter soli (ex Zhang et al. 2022) TaxID=2831468 RepID=A0A942DWN1_9HYPH|nr:cation-translocating P-type ATPase [Pseudaminobacter soli]MBS3648067.1 cadmium-translocating P-type ATPase [Pseudaminobacter soli]
MTCCAPGAEAAADLLTTTLSPDELRLASRQLGDGTSQVELSVPAVHCAACIATIEGSLARLPEVTGARVNLSTRRVTVKWRGDKLPPIVETLSRIGYPPHLFQDGEVGKDRTFAELIRAVAIAGFASGNIMLLSVAVWSGADGATRDLFHLISALIALPTLAFSGAIFYRSAWSALRHGRMNMDVPIAVGITLAYAMSLYETLTHGPHAYFDGVVSLLFFLLIGRTLDHMMRDRARAAVIGLARLAPRGALVIDEAGRRDYRDLAEIAAGDRLLITAGERIPVDGRVEDGASDIDASLVTGESRPQAVAGGGMVRAGTLNLTGPLTVVATAPASDSFLAEMMRMMEAAEGGRTRYRRIADRVSALYAPVVHLTAFITFLGWLAINGDWHQAMTIAIAVLIITCPCALGLAVPIVQVVAGRRLFEHGVMVKDGSAMERLAEADTTVFDKTGTLTLGRPRLVNADDIATELMPIAAELAAHSRHPLSQAIAREATSNGAAPVFADLIEKPGFGIEGRTQGSTWRLGRASWASEGQAADESGTVLARDGRIVANFRFDDVLRQGAAKTIARLKQEGRLVEMLSGDAEPACRATAEKLAIENYAAGLLPAGKVERLEELAREGRKVLFVGDGLNDAPALGAAHVSIAPATAADVGRNAADFVFLRESLEAVPLAIEVSRRAGRLIRQNIALALVYNAIAVPIAILGYVTPLIAAIAMSGSSILVIANALRLLAGSRAPATSVEAEKRPSSLEPAAAS